MAKIHSESDIPWKLELMELVKWISFNRDFGRVASLPSGSFLWLLWPFTLG